MTSPSRPSPSATEPAAPAPAPDSSHLIALAQLWADQLQHMTTLSVAAGGGGAAFRLFTA